MVNPDCEVCGGEGFLSEVDRYSSDGQRTVRCEVCNADEVEYDPE